MKFIFTAPACGLSDTFIERVVWFYNRYNKDSIPQHSPLWSGIITSHFQELHQSLIGNDRAAVRQALSRIWLGGVYGLDDVVGMHLTEEGCQVYEAAFYVALLLTAEQIGVIPFWFDWLCGPRPQMDPDKLFASVTESLGIAGDFPRIGSIAGSEMNGRFVPWKLRFMLPIAATVKQWFGKWPDRTLEIGGGLGFLAWTAMRMRASRYSIVDLPIVSVMQSFVLASALGEESVRFHEEPPSRARLNLYPAGKAAEITGEFDLVVNSDSMTEIPKECALEYLRLVSRILCPGGLFLSINHEMALAPGNTNNIYVPELVATIPNLRCVSRTHFNARPGYAQMMWVKT